MHYAHFGGVLKIQVHQGKVYFLSFYWSTNHKCLWP